MSKVIPAAVEALNRRLEGEDFAGVAKFVIEGEGAILVEGSTASACDDDAEADVTLTATREVFEDLLAGDLNPSTAFMTGKLKVSGAMGQAMKLGSALSS